MYSNLKFSEIINQSNLLGKEVSLFPKYKIYILSNITINPLKEILLYSLRKNSINAVVEIGDYDNIVQDTYNIESANLVIIHYDIITVVENLDVFIEDLKDSEISILLDFLKLNIDTILSNLSTIPLIVFNTLLPDFYGSSSLKVSKLKHIVDEINTYLYSFKLKNLTIFNFQNTIFKLGRDLSFDNRLYYLSKNPYSVSVWKEYVIQLSPLILKNNGIFKKALIFDCDNTLWKGILGEDGFEGIDMSKDSKIGQIYYRIQQIGLWLSNNGVIIGLCSKNNPEDVENVLDFHPDMILRRNNISIFKVNWTDKATNLREIAAELNIGLDSVVFIDDSSFEINLIKEHVPEVLTLQVPKSIHEYPTLIYNLIESSFFLSDSLDDKMKTQQYIDQTKRAQEKEKFNSLEDFLASLNLEVEVFINNTSQIERISQLTQKTNQFNLTTIRYTESQILVFMKDESFDVFSFSVNDKFGQNGLTVVVIANKINNHVILDSFLMSCRVMGRDIEKVIFNYILNFYFVNDFKIIKAKYIKTNKNTPVQGLYGDAGFEIIDQDGISVNYKISIEKYIPFNVNYIKIKHG